MHRHSRNLVVAGAFLASFAALLVSTYWPGITTWDSIEELRQGLHGDFTNWHSPLHAMILAAAHTSSLGLGAALAAQCLVFFGATFAIIRNRPTPARAIGFVVIALLPTTWVLLSTHWKDSWVLGLMAALTACFLARFDVALVVVALQMVAFRHNAIAVAIPFVIAVVWRAGFTPWRRALAVVAVVASLVTYPKLIERAVVAEDVWPIGPTRTWETVGITLEYSSLWRRSPLKQWGSRKSYEREFDVCSSQPLVNSPRLPQLDMRRNALHRDAIEKEWRRLVTRWPWTLIKFRLQAFRCALRIDENAPARPYVGAAQPPQLSAWYGIKNDTQSRAWIALDGVRAWSARETPLFMPKWWLLAALALLPVAYLRRRTTPVALLVLAAGLCSEATLLVAAPSPDHRYSSPMEFGTAAAAVFLLEAALARRRRARPEPTHSKSASAPEEAPPLD